MPLTRRYGLDMTLPEGKLPGFYAQIVKGIAEKSPLSDRHKELLIFDSPDRLPEALKVLGHYKVPSEPVDLLLLPAGSIEEGELYSDYAIVTREDNVYVDAALAAAFVLETAKPEAEPAPALLQLHEHLIASIACEGRTLHLIDRQLSELADRIARAYGCSAVWEA